MVQDLYGVYTQQVKEKVYELSDPHKAYLLRKAMHYFNTRRLHKPAVDDVNLMNRPMIQVELLHTEEGVSTQGSTRILACAATFSRNLHATVSQFIRVACDGCC